MMVSKVKPLHNKVEQTTQAVDNAEHKMMTLENKRKVSRSSFYFSLNIGYNLDTEKPLEMSQPNNIFQDS